MDNFIGFDKKKVWRLPRPSLDLTPASQDYDEVTQIVFLNEYNPHGHRIFNRLWYPDITLKSPENEMIGIYEVNRVSLPIQKMAIDIILAHLLGNKTYIEDSSSDENPALIEYKEYWEDKNIDTVRYDLLKSVLATGDGAALFYKKKGKLRCKVLSAFKRDKFYMDYDKFGDPTHFYHHYKVREVEVVNGKNVPKDIAYCDVYDEQKVYTFSNEAGKWTQIDVVNHGFKGIPVAYKSRDEGAYWTHVQTNIDNLEIMFSRLSEDNRGKFKSMYHMAVSDPERVGTLKAGNMDVVITEEDGKFNLVSGADLSSQFKYEYETQLEMVFQSLGIVFPKHKSSGDMPTGSMKMMFYPTERVVMSLIHEFDSTIDAINNIVLQGFLHETDKFTDDILEGNIRASIRMFTPQDDSTKVDSIVKLKNAGVLSTQTSSEESPYTSNNEKKRIDAEIDEDLAVKKKRADLRISEFDF